MNEATISKETFVKAMLTLFEECYVGPPNPRSTWVTDNEPECGFLGTIGSISATDASRPTFQGQALTVASHAAHIRYALSLANRSFRGENPYGDTSWAESWAVRSVDEASWKALLRGLWKEYEELREILGRGAIGSDETSISEAFGLIAHGAWHLGAIRQALGLVRAPKPQE